MANPDDSTWRRASRRGAAAPGRPRRAPRRDVLVLLALALVIPASGSPPADTAIALALRSGVLARPATVEPRPAQTIEGFGASGAWWTHDLVAFPPEERARVADLLFGPRGIALSSFRYHIGSGGAGVTDPARAPESFATRPGVYDWSRDGAGLTFLRLARERRVPVLVGFAVSPPAFWTSNGKACGGRLLPGAEAPFAAYLADVVAHLREAEGIALTHVSPMNEPDHTMAPCAQEGAVVPVPQRATVVRELARALAARAPHARVIADESSHVAKQFLKEVRGWLAPDIARSLGAIAIHMYDYPDEGPLRAAAAEGARAGRPVWMTELCCYDGAGFGPQFDPTMTSGLWLANTIWQGLARGNQTLFSWWLALSPATGCRPAAEPACPRTSNSRGWNDGLLYYDPEFRRNGNRSIYFTKRFWVMGNFSRFVRPGAVRHEVTGAPDGVRVLAFAMRRGWVVVAVNNVPAPVSLGLRLPPAEGRRLEVTGAFETSATRDLVPVRPPVLVPGAETLVAVLSPRSITTVTLSRS